MGALALDEGPRRRWKERAWVMKGKRTGRARQKCNFLFSLFWGRKGCPTRIGRFDLGQDMVM